MSDELDIEGSHWGDLSSQSQSPSKNTSAIASGDFDSPTQPKPTPKAKSRISTIRSSRARKASPVVHVETVADSDPLGPLGFPETKPESPKQQEPLFVPTDKESAEISKAIQNYNSNNERLALFGHDDPADSPFTAPDRSALVDPVSRLSLHSSQQVPQPPSPGSPPATPMQEPTAAAAPTPAREPAPPVKEVFEISVGDPIKVGDITSAHTVYTVYTKTTSPSFSKSQASVTRRYRDFRWVYHALENNNPGIIIPPPPEKQAMGRFDDDFVEARRIGLETMLCKIAKHPVLQNDPDFRIFLESDTFSTDIKSKQYHVQHQPPTGTESKGFMSSLSGAFSFSGKFVESDQWFIDKKVYVDTLETQFKQLAKTLDLVIAQRKELSDATADFSAILTTLSQVELSTSFSQLIQSFAETEQRIRDLYFRQCMQDVMSLATTLEEYTRLIGAIRMVFSQRQTAYFTLQAAEQEQSKKKSNLNKVIKSGKTLQDKIALLTDEVAEQDKRVLNARVAFDDISKLIVNEFARFEVQKAADFRNSVELFMENAIEAQKEAIEVWETFYQLNGLGSARMDTKPADSAPAETATVG